MTYCEIIMWIERYLVTLVEVDNGVLQMTYLDKLGYSHDVETDTLIKGVLAVNGLDLIG